ncbi:MAG: hypothetical protein LBB43_00480, partial [Spirochaetaceae bacterium]|nr:hypothetical protein [Spirochaetaceae bacterium]
MKSVEMTNNKAQSGYSGKNRGQTSQPFFVRSYNVSGSCTGFGRHTDPEADCKELAGQTSQPFFVRSYNIEWNCAGCGICRKLCPMKSVEMTNNKAQSGYSGKNRGQTSQ